MAKSLVVTYRLNYDSGVTSRTWCSSAKRENISFLIHLLRGLTRVTCTTNKSQPCHSIVSLTRNNSIRMLRKYANTGTLEMQSLRSTMPISTPYKRYRSRNAHTHICSLFLIHLLRGLTRVTYTTNKSHPCHSIVSLTRNNTTRMLRKYLTRASRSNTGFSSELRTCLWNRSKDMSSHSIQLELDER